MSQWSKQEMFEVDFIWEAEAIRFSKQVEQDEIRKNGSKQSTIVKEITEDSNVKIPDPDIATAEKLTVKITEESNVKIPDIPSAGNSTVKIPTAEENLHTNSQEQDEALEESEWAFEAQLHDAAGVGPEDDKIWEKYYKINKKKD